MKIPTFQTKIIAREWIIFVCSLIVGIVYTVFVYYPISDDYMIIRKRLYEGLKGQYDRTITLPDLPPLPEELELKAKESKHPKLLESSENNSIVKIEDKSRIKLNYFLPSSIPSFEPIIDTSVHLGTFVEFSASLDDKSKRRSFYDSISVKFDVGDFATYESKISPPSVFSVFPKFFKHLFSKWYWFDAWLSICMPYIFFQFLRSIIYSIKVLINK